MSRVDATSAPVVHARAADPLGAAQHLASGPPDLSRHLVQLVRSAPLQIERPSGERAAARLRDYLPRGEPPRDRPADRLTAQQRAPFASGQQALRRRGALAAGPRVSAEERAERQRICSPADGVGFAFGADLPDPGEVNRWYGALSVEQRAAFAHERSQLTIIARTSAPGTRSSNLRLARRRAATMQAILREQLGFKGEIAVELRVPRGPGQDGAHNRVCHLRLRTGAQRFHDQIRRAGQAWDAWRQAHPRPARGSARGTAQPVTQLPPELRREPFVEPDVVDGRLWLPNPADRFDVRAIRVADLPEEWSVQNGHFVAQTEGENDGDRVITRPRYLDDASSLLRVWAAQGHPITARQAERLAGVNRWLNSRVEHHLGQHLTLERAFAAARQDAVHRLKRVIVDVLGLLL